jgi:murein DD-endopeptidase MepM/ murein hydrolase activator NlpD
VSHPGPGAAGHVPQPGRTPGYRIAEGSPTGEAGFINVNERLFAPLQGLNPADVTQGGYGWLDLTDGGRTYHPGVDLNSGGSCNADEGLLVVAPLAAIVRAAILWDGTTMGEGSHVWLEVVDELDPGPVSTWVHYDHLQRIDCQVGQRLAAGERCGRAGRSGGWDCAHLHTELVKGPPPNGYWMWPYGWTQEQVEDVYYEPAAWWRAASARAQGAPEEAVSMILSGAQTAVVQASIWGAYWNPEASEHAIQASWRDEWRRGVWRGAPLSEEQPLPPDPTEDKPAGTFRLFEQGVACWLDGLPVSWNG